MQAMKKILLLVLFLFRLNIRQCIYFLGVIKLQDTYENYVGRIIQNERVRRGLTIYDVSAGICSASVYVKLESGDYAGGIHILRALCQRLGINSDRCGTYLAKAEYDEMMDRLYILEDIREGRLDKAWAGVEKYRTTYKDIPLNNQFIMFIRGRLAELDGEREKALEERVLVRCFVLHTLTSISSVRGFSPTIIPAYTFSPGPMKRVPRSCAEKRP